MVILAAIVLTSIKLVFDTYLELPNEIGLFFTIFFSIEAVIKSIAFGFVLDKNSYLRENWSQLDFFIVVTSCVDEFTTGKQFLINYLILYLNFFFLIIYLLLYMYFF